MLHVLKKSGAQRMNSIQCSLSSKKVKDGANIEVNRREKMRE